MKMAMIAAMVMLTAAVAMGQATQPCADGDQCAMKRAGVTSASAPAPASAPGSEGQQLPAGHPPIGMPTAAGGTLPQGHPPIEGMVPSPVMAQPVKVELAVRARQGTAGGPAVAGDEVAVKLYAGNELVKEIPAKLDEHGVATLEDLTIDRAVQALVTVNHKGVSFEAVGGVLNGQQKRATVDVTVYEPTEQAPPWTVKMRHVMVLAGAGGLKVAEVVVVENPSDKAWLGVAGENGKRKTVAVQLPHDVAKVQIISGFDECCATLGHGELADGKPLLPGEQQFRYLYDVPARGGRAEVTLGAAAPTERLMVFLPDDGTTVTASGLESMGAMKMGERSARALRAQGVAAGQTVGFAVEGLADLPAGEPGGELQLQAAAGGKPDSATTAKAVVGVGGAVAAAAVVAVMVTGNKRGKGTKGRTD